MPPPTKGGPDPDTVPTARMVPLINAVQAGRWTEVADPYPAGHGSDYVPAYRQLGPHAFALRIKGDSMEPQFHEGDIIIVDPDIEPMPGNFVVAKISRDQEATFKKFRLRSEGRPTRQTIELVPLNPDWP
ncbi:S24 family peptidase, partial [Vineibacter terrae]|uniref:LexA family protein n=1 Tax=Vineibacter terrae TaxID=2586908 RepID=UPI002E2F8BBD